MTAKIRPLSAASVVKSVKAGAKKPDVRLTHTVDPGVAAAFKAACKRHGVPASRIVEELMRRFVEGG